MRPPLLRSGRPVELDEAMPRRLALLLAPAICCALPPPAVAQAPAGSLNGTVLAAGKPVRGSAVTLYAAGATAATPLGSATTDSQGQFTIAYANPAGNAPLYTIASGGTDAGGRLRLMGVAGRSSGPLPAVTINEVTTVASAYALARFLHGTAVTGPSPGLENAAATAFNLADMQAGKVSFVLANPPNGIDTNALPAFATLANALASCTTGTARECARLFAATTPTTGVAPKNTLDAVLDVALQPTNRVRAVFAAASASGAYQPVLDAPPDAWILLLKYTAGGFDAPGNIAFDASGNVWANNNFAPPGSNAGHQLTVLSPTGVPIMGSPLYGGGLNGAGFGIAIDRQGSVWIGNYTGDSVSKFSASGTPLSPDTGWGDVVKPQGLAVSAQGTVWIPNLHDASVTRYPGGNPDSPPPRTTGTGIEDPFDIATDAAGNAWVSNDKAVTEIDPSGNLVATVTGGGQKSDKGIAIDSVGNLWVASFEGQAVTEVTGAGKVSANSPIRSKSINGPWGVAVDGDDNVWVADFLGDAFVELCGRDAASCPRKPNGQRRRTGDTISPPRTGYTNTGVQHLTCVQVDPSGNVWGCNNWTTGSSFKDFVGGDGLVELVGAAAPVKAPLVGPPQRP
jgi:streptogramin lyase